MITSRITLNGFRTTIAGNDSTFRIFLVTSSGNLTLQGLTITGGNTSGPGGGIFNLEGTLTLNHSTGHRQRVRRRDDERRRRHRLRHAWAPGRSARPP